MDDLENDNHSSPVTEEDVIKILRIQAERRNKLQLNTLTRYLSKIKFFLDYVKNGKQEVVHQCSKHFFSRYYPKGKAIMVAGEEANEFYINLRGKVSVYLSNKGTYDFTFKELCKFLKYHQGFVNAVNNKPMKPTLINFLSVIDENCKPLSKDFEDMRYVNYSVQFLINIMSYYLTRQIILYINLIVINDFYSPATISMINKLQSKTKQNYAIDYMFKIADLKAGNIFGELALLHNHKRSATLVAAEDTW